MVSQGLHPKPMKKNQQKEQESLEPPSGSEFKFYSERALQEDVAKSSKTSK